MIKKILTVRNFLLSLSLLLLFSPTVVFATELESEAVYEEVQSEEPTQEATEEVQSEESTQEATEEVQSEESTQEATEEVQSEESTQEATEETESVVIYETSTGEDIEETETSEAIVDNTQPIQISIQTDNANIIENTDENGNIIGYTVSSNDIETEITEVDLTGVETLLETTNEQLQDITLILYVIAVLLGGFLIYVLIHWALNRKGVLE